MSDSRAVQHAGTPAYPPQHESALRDRYSHSNVSAKHWRSSMEHREQLLGSAGLLRPLPHLRQDWAGWEILAVSATGGQHVRQRLARNRPKAHGMAADMIGHAGWRRALYEWHFAVARGKRDAPRSAAESGADQSAAVVSCSAIMRHHAVHGGVSEYSSSKDGRLASHGGAKAAQTQH